VNEKLALLIGISDNNDAINEFNKLIKPDLLVMSGRSLIKVNRLPQNISIIGATVVFMATNAGWGSVLIRRGLFIGHMKM
jgi:hypothetical protein